MTPHFSPLRLGCCKYLSEVWTPLGQGLHRIVDELAAVVDVARLGQLPAIAWAKVEKATSRPTQADRSEECQATQPLPTGAGE